MKFSSIYIAAFFIFLGFVPAVVFAGAGTQGAAFLEIPVGAGPAAMGSAYTALADNAYASVWNPGALAFVDSFQVAGQHLSYLESINDEYVGVALPVPHVCGAIGLSGQYLGTGDITQTTTVGANAGTFDAYYGAYSLAYGQKLTDSLGFGATAKWLNAKLGGTSANAFAGDLGLLYKPQASWRLAATLTNLGNKLEFVDQADSLPSAFHLAAAVQPTRHWTLSGEALHSWPADRFDGRVGIEWKPWDLLALRTGYRSDTVTQLSALAGFTVGAGIQVWDQEFAYAWVPYGELGATQYFSLLLRFGAHPEGRRNLIQFKENPKFQAAIKTQDPSDPDAQGLIQLIGNESNQLAFADVRRLSRP